MPRVGDRKFSYDPQGIQKAREYSAETGIPMEIDQKYNVGGLVKTGGRKRKPFTTRGVGKATKGTRTKGSV